MKKILLLTLSLLVLLIIGRLFYNHYKYKYCLENGYNITYVTSTIHTIGKTTKNNHIWFLRGKIEIFYIHKGYIIGYLSTKHFKEDRLLGLEGQYDKEGYFIMNLKKEKIQSGLNEKEYTLKVHDTLNIDVEKIKYEKFPFFSFSCLF